ncbi:RLF2 [Candida oxycetoniae]|uniref:RLF2 n=1 Tax=Candida oxycetoniae TaxID=497107 RepID=A0AAI9SWX5_9ASCO|nr:RLF2 [Candida oxycetoniae]KAI3404624.2 RLF2 [Candida oxycetoniae]
MSQFKDNQSCVYSSTQNSEMTQKISKIDVDVNEVKQQSVNSPGGDDPSVKSSGGDDMSVKSSGGDDMSVKSTDVDDPSVKSTDVDDKSKKKQEEIRQKEAEKIAKKRKLEEEKETKKRKQEEEREEKEAKKRKLEEERELKRKRLEEEKRQREKKKQEEKLQREKKKELERLEREKKKQIEQEERERKKQIEQEERERKKQAEQLERERKKQAEQMEKERKREEREKERLERKQKIEDDKRAKEREKERLEEEKRKAEEAKERCQLKISNFFHVGSSKKAMDTTATQMKTETIAKTDYESVFLPFFVQKNVILKDTVLATPQSIQTLDQILSSSSSIDQVDFGSFLKDKYTLSSSVEEAPIVVTPESILTALNMSTTTEVQIYKMIDELPSIKYIRFYENSKPPYVGTWNSTKHQSQLKNILRNPLDVSTTAFNYDYDSDLEWNEEDKEGDDIDDEDEDDDEALLPDEDDEEFIENDAQVSSRNLKQLIVINKWNDENSKEFFNGYSTVNLVSAEKLKCI